jgi:putative ABC transport system substrate-binding protein
VISDQLTGETGQNMPLSTRIFGLFCLLITISLITGLRAHAQQPKKIPRVGVLLALPQAAISDRIDAFRIGLRARGYVEGETVAVEYRYADGKFERLPDLAAELVRIKVDVIVTGGPTATRPARAATSVIPIVMAQDSDPVGNKFVASLARPGGNITGLSNYYPELSGKQLELLKEIIPKLVRLAILGNSNEPGNAQALSEAERAAVALKVRIFNLDVRGAQEVAPAFRVASEKRADAVLVLSSPIATSQRNQIAQLAIKGRLPAMYQVSESVEAGGLMTYGVNIPDLWRRSASYVDKILRGSKPSELPVEQPTKFEFVINLKAAKQIGLTIPPNVLANASRIIR